MPWTILGGWLIWRRNKTTATQNSTFSQAIWRIWLFLFRYQPCTCRTGSISKCVSLVCEL